MRICTPFIRLKNGTKLYAKDRGLKAFCFEVTEEQNKKYQARIKRARKQQGGSKS